MSVCLSYALIHTPLNASYRIGYVILMTAMPQQLQQPLIHRARNNYAKNRASYSATQTHTHIVRP